MTTNKPKIDYEIKNLIVKYFERPWLRNIHTLNQIMTFCGADYKKKESRHKFKNTLNQTEGIMSKTNFQNTYYSRNLPLHRVNKYKYTDLLDYVACEVSRLNMAKETLNQKDIIDNVNREIGGYFDEQIKICLNEIIRFGHLALGAGDVYNNIGKAPNVYQIYNMAEKLNKEYKTF